MQQYTFLSRSIYITIPELSIVELNILLILVLNSGFQMVNVEVLSSAYSEDGTIHPLSFVFNFRQF